METRSSEPRRGALRSTVDATWRSARFVAGMGILGAVFVVSHVLVLVEGLANRAPAADYGVGR
jgi:hypothetical protein